MALKKGVFILEGVPQYENKDEGNLLYEFLRMMIPEKIDLWYDLRSYDDIFSTIATNYHKFLHISTHGGVDKDDKVFLQFPRNMKIYSEDLVDIKGLNSRHVLITACEAGHSSFIEELYDNTKVESVIAPQNEIIFEDSAMWCINYYYQLFRNDLDVNKTFRYMQRKFYIQGAFTKYP